MNQLLHILKYKFISFINYNKGILKSRSKLLRSLLSSIVFVAFGIGTFAFTYNVIEFLLENVKIGMFLLHRFSSLVLFVFFLSVSAGNMVVAYSMLFKSEEVHHLLTKPLTFENLFILKIIESILLSSPTFLLMGITILSGYGWYFEQQWYFYPFAILFVFFPFVFASAFLGIMLLILLIQIAGKIGVRWTIFSVMFFYVSLMIGFFKYVNPKQLVNEVMRYYPNVDLNFSFLDPVFLIFTPNHWFMESLYWFVRGKHSIAINYALILNLLCAAFLISLILIGNRLYRKSFSISLDLKSNREIRNTYKRVFPKSTKFVDFKKDYVFKNPVNVLLKKEFYQFFREPAQWIHMSVIMFLIVIFIISVARVDLLNTLPFLQTITYLSVFIFNSFLISSITLRFIYPVMSVEAQAFWKIRTSPVESSIIVMAKFLPVFIITLIIAESLNYFSHLSKSIPEILRFYSSINIFSVTLTLSSLNFWFGNYFVSYNEKNPVKIASTQGSVIAFLFNLIYLILLVVILIGSIDGLFNRLIYTTKVQHTPFIITSSILLLIGIVMFLLAYVRGIKTLSMDY